MKVLIVCSGNAENFDFKLHQAFVYEQIETIKQKFNIEYDTFLIKGKGIKGYLNSVPAMKQKIKDFSPDIVHAHFGISGLTANLQRKVSVITTYHGSDAYLPKVRLLSIIAAVLSVFNIFVSEKIRNNIRRNKQYSVIPCGINLDIFYPIEMKIARQKLNFDQGKVYVLFSSGFDNSVKNSALAFSGINLLQMDIELIELKNKNREEVNLLLNACNLLILTSISEGSPQIIKEAMACNCPIVSTDVGDIREVISDTEGCYISLFNPDDVADKIKLAIEFNKKTNGREKIKHFDNNLIAKKIYEIYQMIVSKK